MTVRLQALVIILTLGACDCEADVPDEGDEPVIAWASLRYCLTGTDEPTPELIRGIEQAADLEVTDDIPDPGPAAGEMGREPLRPSVSRAWPRRCRYLARDLEHALNDAPEEHLAHRVSEALFEGEIDPALYSLVEATREWPSVAVSGVTPPPPPASSLAGADAQPLVEGRGCVATVVLGDATTTPMQQVAQVACPGHAHHECVFSGRRLETVRCETVNDLPRVWTLHRAEVGNWTAEMQRDESGCHAVIDGAKVGDFECPEGEMFWTRPCRAGDFGAAALVTPRHSMLAIREGRETRLVEAPLSLDGGVTLSCTPRALFAHETDATFEFLDDEMRPGMIRPPARSILQVRVTRCAAAGCETTEAQTIEHGMFARAAPLGEGVITAELVKRDEGDGVIVHASSLEALPDSPPRWVLHPSDGIHLSDRFAWVPGAEAAVLLVADEARGPMAIHFDVDGEATFLTP